MDELEQVIRDWVNKEFPQKIRVDYWATNSRVVNVYSKSIVIRNYCVANIGDDSVTLGPEPCETIKASDPDFFDRLRKFIQPKVNNGYLWTQERKNSKRG